MGIFDKKKEVIPEMKKSHEFAVAVKPEGQSIGSSETESIPEKENQAQARPAEIDQPGLAPTATANEQSNRQTAQAASKSVRQAQIEHILEADLGEAYFQMDTQHQAMFKAAGEDTAQKIEGLLALTKVKTQQIFELIKSWLQLIPGVNKWFIMQASKIKTDNISKIPPSSHESELRRAGKNQKL